MRISQKAIDRITLEVPQAARHVRQFLTTLKSDDYAIMRGHDYQSVTLAVGFFIAMELHFINLGYDPKVAALAIESVKATWSYLRA